MKRITMDLHSRNRFRIAFAALLCATTIAAASTLSAQARTDDSKGQDGQHGNDAFTPGNLVVSRSTFSQNAGFSQYPFIWNTVLTDASFGITSPIFLDQLSLQGALINSLEVPNSLQHGVPPTKDQMVTSFSSKSELALNLSTDGSFLTFMGYLAPVDGIDVSNSNTPAAIDSTNPVTSVAYRSVAQVDQHGKFQFTKTNAYSGNNGRAAILNNRDGGNAYFTAGNAGNGSNPQPAGIIIGAGAQIITPENKAEVAQRPGDPTPAGSFSVTELGGKADKLGKDDNFRGLTIFDDVLYFTKGSGSNGVNTVYFVDTRGGACPNGVGLPHHGATLPSMPLAYDSTALETTGLPSNMCILSGFPSTRNSALKATTTAYPFGIWFADANTLYVADEGDGDPADETVATSGLQKWVFNSGTSSWVHVYTLQNGLGLGATYRFPGDSAYPTGVNAATGLPWAPVTDGLRNITGRVNFDGTVTIWGITSTVSGNGDQGADPNKLVAITDVLGNTTPALAATEHFVTVRTAGYGEVLRGVAFTPGTRVDQP
jgi:hypothetical protein